MALTLPPLNALRAFEAAARNGGYVAAAKELNVSPAAISQLVSKLELFYGRKLFARLNNRVVLTDAGHAVVAGSSDALQAISALTGQIATGQVRSRLVVSCLPSVVHRWLQPRLATFLLQFPKVQLELRADEDPVDLVGNAIDVRLCYGARIYPELTNIVLGTDRVFPMCSPNYRDRLRICEIADVPENDLIHVNWGPSFASYPNWQSWLSSYQPKHNRASAGHQIGSSSLALDMARDGVGVVLGQEMLAEADLRSGRLIALSSSSLPLGHPYCLVTQGKAARKSGAQALVEFLVSERKDLDL